MTLKSVVVLFAVSQMISAHVLPWAEDDSETSAHWSPNDRTNVSLHGFGYGSWNGHGNNRRLHTIHLFPPNPQRPKERQRTYFIGAVETDWDYAPSGKNLVTDDQTLADAILKGGADRIGSTYRKVLYRRFTDLTFTEQIPNPVWMGLMGPLIKSQEGETIVIYFKNMAYTANRNFSIHPHGVNYNKNAEGALYVDNTSPVNKLDDEVPPGTIYKYVWRVTRNYTPARKDSACLPYVYHSHVDAPRDISTGLMGPMIVCKRNALSRYTGKRRDVDKDFYAYFDVIDENESWLVEENLKRCGSPPTCQALYNSGDPAFIASNKFPSINGRVFGNLDGFEVVRGERVAFNALGLEQGIHGVQIYGQTFQYINRRLSTLSVFPASFVSAEMVPRVPGRWLMLSVNSNEYPSMAAFFTVKKRRWNDVDVSFHTNQRKYYITAEEVTWNYGPSGTNNFEGGDLDAPGSPSAPYFEQGPLRIGGEFKKARYFAYTDDTFQTKLPDIPGMGIIGPVIKAEVGEEVKVVFKNMASRKYSILPHGVKFTKQEEGAVYKSDPSSNTVSGKVAQPGETITYTFSVPFYAAPTSDDDDCVAHTYHSAVEPARDIASGLMGPLLVCKFGSLSSSGNQRRVDKEFHLMFYTFDEKLSWYLDENIQKYTGNPAAVDKTDSNFLQSLRKHSINGRMFANLDGLDMCKDDTVSWNVYGLGGFYDLHGVHFHGNTMNIHSLNKDAMVVIPGSSFTGEMITDNEGSWAVVCRTNFHFHTGMKAIYNVDLCGAPARGSPVPDPRAMERQYFIAVEEIEWDYAPNKIDPVTKQSLLDPNTFGYIYARNDTGFIGTTYKKLAYREYTDASFATRKVRTQEENHLGILGPMIKAEVGDTIKVTLKNTADVPVSIHPHGVVYASGPNKSVDGKPVYSDVQPVAPNSIYTYTWSVPSRAGPGNRKAKCASWPYYSFADNSVRDTNTGLIGPMVICDRGVLREDGSRKDVDRELAIMFTVMDENQSWLLDKNIQQFAPSRVDKRDPQFQESNKMNSINGYIYANVPDMTMYEKQEVAWYVIGMGSSLDIHTVHFHGQTFLHQTNQERRHDVIEVFPSTSEVVEMYTDNPGSWILHCHFGPHIKGGMELVYTILPCQHKDYFGRCQ